MHLVSLQAAIRATSPGRRIRFAARRDHPHREQLQAHASTGSPRSRPRRAGARRGTGPIATTLLASAPATKAAGRGRAPSRSAPAGPSPWLPWLVLAALLMAAGSAFAQRPSPQPPLAFGEPARAASAARRARSPTLRAAAAATAWCARRRSPAAGRASRAPPAAGKGVIAPPEHREETRTSCRNNANFWMLGHLRTSRSGRGHLTHPLCADDIMSASARADGCSTPAKRRAGYCRILVMGVDRCWPAADRPEPELRHAASRIDRERFPSSLAAGRSPGTLPRPGHGTARARSCGWLPLATAVGISPSPSSGSSGRTCSWR